MVEQKFYSVCERTEHSKLFLYMDMFVVRIVLYLVVGVFKGRQGNVN